MGWAGGVLPVGAGFSRLEEQLTGHPQVHDQALRVVQRQDDVFSATLHGHHGPSREPPAKRSRSFGEEIREEDVKEEEAPAEGEETPAKGEEAPAEKEAPAE